MTAIVSNFIEGILARYRAASGLHENKKINGRVGGRSESSPAPLVAPDVRISRIRRSHRLNQRHYA